MLTQLIGGFAGSSTSPLLNRNKPFGSITYWYAGDFSFICPPNVLSVCIVGVGPGTQGGPYGDSYGGSSGACVWSNNVPVVPGTSYNVHVGAANTSNERTYFGPSGSPILQAPGGIYGGHRDNLGGGTRPDLYWPMIGQNQAAGGRGNDLRSNGSGGYLSAAIENSSTVWTNNLGVGAACNASAGVPVTGTGLWGIPRFDPNGPAKPWSPNAGLGRHFFGGGGLHMSRPGLPGGLRIIWGEGRSYPYDALPVDLSGNPDPNGLHETYYGY